MSKHRVGNKGLLCPVCIPSWHLLQIYIRTVWYYLFSVSLLSLSPLPLESSHQLPFSQQAFPRLSGTVSAKQTATLASDKFRAAICHIGCKIVSWAGPSFLLDSAFSFPKTQIQRWPGKRNVLLGVSSFVKRITQHGLSQNTGIMSGCLYILEMIRVMVRDDWMPEAENLNSI